MAQKKLTAMEMVLEYIAPGCVGETEKVSLDKDNNIENYRPGTFILGPGSFMLGMPKGFNKPFYHYNGNINKDDRELVWLGVYESFEQFAEKFKGFDNLNIPVWYTQKDGMVFVRCISPRVNSIWILIIQHDNAEELFESSPIKPLNVAEFEDNID